LCAIGTLTGAAITPPSDTTIAPRALPNWSIKNRFADLQEAKLSGCGCC
jgi:hypothetical protein